MVRRRVLHQARISGGGILTASIGVPVLAALWTPTVVVIGWAVMYLLFNSVMLFATSARRSEQLGFIWATGAAIFAAGAIFSVVIWGDARVEAPWIATMLGMTAIAFDLATGPFHRIPYWFVPTGLIGAAVSITLWISVRPLFALLVLPAIISMLVASAIHRQRSRQLDARLIEAERMLGQDPLTLSLIHI